MHILCPPGSNTQSTSSVSPRNKQPRLIRAISSAMSSIWAYFSPTPPSELLHDEDQNQPVEHEHDVSIADMSPTPNSKGRGKRVECQMPIHLQSPGLYSSNRVSFPPYVCCTPWTVNAHYKLENKWVVVHTGLCHPQTIESCPFRLGVVLFLLFLAF